MTRLLSTLIHEIIHSYSVDYQNKNKVAFQDHDSDLNEAMTELIKDKVYNEYIKRSGSRDLILVSSGGKPMIRKTYLVERKNLENKIVTISEYSGLSQEDVFYSLVSAYFRGEYDEVIRYLV